MVITDNGEKVSEIEESNNCPNVKSTIPLHISTSQRGLISNENHQSETIVSATLPPQKTRFFKFVVLDSPSLKFQKIAQQKDKYSRTVPSSHAFRDSFRRVFNRKIDWVSLSKLCKEWIRDPMNMVLLVWIICVTVSGAILFLVMTGMLNHVLPRKSQRDAWFEVNNQILNALFTLMCLYQHPHRLYHLVLLLRWRREDILKLRKIYCKGGTYKPHEWAHMMVVVGLLNLNCFAQYALCGLNVGYRRSNRPAIGVGVCISFAIGAPAIAGVYSIMSPLGKEYHLDEDEESQINQITPMSLEKRFSFLSRDEGRIQEQQPQWSGGIFDFWDDISTAYLSLFFSFCVFGWNMERLGFGNMYVHIATFLLFCMAPFWIFNLAAVNINNETVREALGITGVFLCVFGLLYGGFWRIQMRKRFNLPGSNFCCNRPAITDCALWLFCCWCSLAQEVRTGNSYDVVENKLFKKEDEMGQLPISPLPHEDGEFEFRSDPNSPQIISKANNTPSPSRLSRDHNEIPDSMIPPAANLIKREDT